MYGVISAQRPARSAENIDLMETLLEGNRIILRPLQYTDAEALVRAAADGELWNLTVTIVPSSTTVDSYLKKALDGRDAGSVLPFVIVLKTRARSSARHASGKSTDRKSVV